MDKLSAEFIKEMKNFKKEYIEATELLEEKRNNLAKVSCEIILKAIKVVESNEFQDVEVFWDGKITIDGEVYNAFDYE